MDFYVILGIERESSPGDVKRAYKRLARRYHPDINPGDRESEAFFRRATEAYETLSDPDRRRQYDVHGTTGRSARSESVEFQGFDFTAPVSGASATFTELFSDVLGAAADPRPPDGEQGSDLHGEVSLGFEEALRGTERELTVTRLETCAACDGSGLRRAAESRCTRCHGVGTTRWRRGHMVFSKTCAYCGGSGRQRHRPCDACRSDGLLARQETITIHVPAGVHDGARLRVAGKGNAGQRDGLPGDLYIVLHVEPHPMFRRDGDDVHVDVPIAVHEAALGAKIEVPTVDGPARLRIPPDTQPGQRFRLRARGAPSPRTGGRGDLVVEIHLVMPKLEDERSKELLREFGRIHGDDVRRHLFPPGRPRTDEV